MADGTGRVWDLGGAEALHRGCVREHGEGLTEVDPDVIIEDEVAVGIDVEVWGINAPFGFELESFNRD